MKKNILIGATLAIVGLASAPLFAQTQSTTTTSTTGYIQSSNVIGSKIKDSRGQDVGEIKDFVLDRQTGCLAYVVLSTRGGGTTTTTTKTVAAPWSDERSHHRGHPPHRAEESQPPEVPGEGHLAVDALGREVVPGHQCHVQRDAGRLLEDRPP